MDNLRFRNLKIKTGVVKRLVKEKIVYEREAEEQTIRIEKYREHGMDEEELRKQEGLLKESIMMVPDCKRRLAVAFEDLKKLLDGEQDLVDSECYKHAQEILEDARLHLPKKGELRHMC